MKVSRTKGVYEFLLTIALKVWAVQGYMIVRDKYESMKTTNVLVLKKHLNIE